MLLLLPAVLDTTTETSPSPENASTSSLILSFAAAAAAARLQFRRLQSPLRSDGGLTTHRILHTRTTSTATRESLSESENQDKEVVAAAGAAPGEFVLGDSSQGFCAVFGTRFVRIYLSGGGQRHVLRRLSPSSNENRFSSHKR